MSSNDYFKKDTFAQLLGVEYLENDFNCSKCRLVTNSDHYNGLGTIHGAIIFSLADIAFAYACNATEDTFIGIQTEIRYMHKPKGKTLTATTELVNSSKKMAHYQVIVSDEEDNKIALFTATAYKL